MSFKFRRGHLAALSICLVLGACGSNAGKNENAPLTPTTPSDIAGTETGVEGYSSDTWPIGDTVHFETDSYIVSPEAQATLQRQAAWLLQNLAATITVEGHADERGTREYNLALAERRANAAAGYLAALGIDAGRLSVISYGKERPVCGDGTSACWAENRRAVSALNPQ